MSYSAYDLKGQQLGLMGDIGYMAKYYSLQVGFKKIQWLENGSWVLMIRSNNNYSDSRLQRLYGL